MMASAAIGSSVAGARLTVTRRPSNPKLGCFRLPSSSQFARFTQPRRFSTPRVQASPVSKLQTTESREDSKVPVIETWFKNIFKAAIVSALALSLALGSPSAAEAARSGGRAGGSSFSSRGSSMSRSYSAPSRSTFGGGMSSTTVYRSPSVTIMPSVMMPGYGYSLGYSAFETALILMLVVVVFAYLFNSTATSTSGFTGVDAAMEEDVSVMKVQVGLLGVARSLKGNLDSIAQRADTSDPEGLNFLLQEAALALLRNPDYYVYGGAACEVLRDSDAAERAYNRVSMEERSKFQEETFSNVGGVTRRRAMSQGGGGGVNELMVVTIVIAAEGRWKLPPVRSAADLRTCLNYIASIGASKLIGVELLWTPEAEGDYYTRDEVITDYPNLVPLV